MSSDKSGRRAAGAAAVFKLLAVLSPLLLPALSACTTAEGTNAFATPATFEREVMTSTLQGLDIVGKDSKKPDDQTRAPLVMPKQTAQLPAPTKNSGDVAMLPADSNNPQINTAGLTQADLDHLRNARVVDLSSVAGRPLTDAERKQLVARMQAANMQVSENGSRALTLPPADYFSSYHGKDAVCLAKDGTLVSLSDPKCPDEIKKAMRRDGPAGNGVAAAISRDTYNMKNGLDANGQ
ncbi:MAG: hypothetical protein P4M09_31160 [Devosia sp.]|nr:hypothetical protein [Devosia sp.]